MLFSHGGVNTTPRHQTRLELAKGQPRMATPFKLEPVNGKVSDHALFFFFNLRIILLPGAI